MTKKLKWPGFSEMNTVIIGLAADAFCFPAGELFFQDITFTAKEELHVTLIGSTPGSRLKQRINHNQTIENTLKKTFEEIDWSYKQTGPVHLLSRSKGNVIQNSIIMLIDMCGVSEFYEQLQTSGIIDPETPVPLPHITLYTHNCPAGISVPGIEALNKLSANTFSLDDFNALIKK